MSVNGEAMVKIIPIHNKINFWNSFWLELAGIPRRIVPPPGGESKMLSKVGLVGTPMSGAQMSLAFVLKGPATQSAAHAQFSSVVQLCPTPCDPMNCSTPGLPVHHQLPESTQTHVHQVGDAIQPSHPLLSPSLPVPNPSQHQGFFK